MPDHPLAEVFGFPIDDMSQEAKRYRNNLLCPFNNKVPNCTKDKADDPLGTCSIYHGSGTAITCPIRFREGWLIAEHAARFFFPAKAKWTSLVEVKLDDADGKSAGNIDVVLVSYDERGKISDFGGLEVQAVYISGNIRDPFRYYMKDPETHRDMTWRGKAKYPRADYLSSSRKRLLPQLLYKGTILKAWGKKQAVALHKDFYAELPDLPEVDEQEAELAWLLYDLSQDPVTRRYHLSHHKTVYTKFEPALLSITTPKIGSVDRFVAKLQFKLDNKLDDGTPPDTLTLLDEELT